MKLFFFLLIILSSQMACGAGQAIVLDEKKHEINIGPFLDYLDDSNENLTIQEIDRPETLGKFRPSLGELFQPSLSSTSLWVRIEIDNIAAMSDWLLEIQEAKIESVEFYYKDSNSEWKTISSGYAFPIVKYKESSTPLFPLEFHRTITTVYLHIKNPVPCQLRLITTETWEKTNRIQIFVTGIKSGIFLLLSLYLFFIQLAIGLKQKLLFFITVSTAWMTIASFDGTLRNISTALPGGTFLVLSMALTLLVLFQAKLLLSKDGQYLTGKVLTLCSAVTLAAVPVLLLLKQAQAQLLIQFVNITIYLIIVIAAIRSNRIRQEFAAKFLKYSFVVLVIPALLEFFHGLTGLGYLLGSFKEWEVIGVVLILNYALLLRSETNAIEQELTKELKWTKALDELVEKTGKERDISMLELSGLRSQLNPHFIFNSLNAINRFVITSNPVGATDYIVNFSKLMRIMLEGSKGHKVVLKKEIQLLTLYLQVEQVRYQNKFDFRIDVDTNVNTEVLIPSMVIQPFVENSIWHGLLPKGGGTVTIKMAFKNQFLECIVEDNGVGRRTKEKAVTVELPSKKSPGMQVTEDRLKTLNNIFKHDSRIEVIDLKNEAQQPCGTRIELTLQYDISNIIA